MSIVMIIRLIIDTVKVTDEFIKSHSINKTEETLWKKEQKEKKRSKCDTLNNVESTLSGKTTFHIFFFVTGNRKR